MSDKLIIRNTLDIASLGDIFVNSGFFQESKQAAQAIVKILAGQELGFGPIASMTGINVIRGRISLSANLIAAAIKRSERYDYRIKKQSGEGCIIEFFQDDKLIGESSFTKEDATQAGLLNGDNWKKYPRNMYFARALSNGAKWFCPDVFNGPVYTPDELGAEIDGETGEIVIDSQPVQPKNGNVERNRYIARIEELRQEAEGYGDCLTIDQTFLDTASLPELVDFGKELARRVEVLRVE